MNEIKIIKATQEEIPDIVFLNTFVQRIHAERYPDVFRPTDNPEEVTQFFEYIFSKEQNIVLLAYSERTPVGYLWAAFEQKPENPFMYEQKRIYIYHVAVHDQYRCQGVGHALFGELEHIAQEKRINQFALDSWAFNKSAHNFFEKLGFVAYNINMWRRP